MELPIDVFPDTDPPKFKWTQTITGSDTAAVSQECEGMLPPSCERAVEALIAMTKASLKDCAMLRGQVDGMRRRSDQLDRDAQQRVAAAAPLKATSSTTTTSPQIPNKK